MPTLKILTWVTHGESNCPDCDALDGSTHTETEWASTIQPGFHRNCDCTLEITGEIPYALDQKDMLQSLMEHINNRLRVSTDSIRGGFANSQTVGGMDPRPTPTPAQDPGHHLKNLKRIR
jgi:hypothetical protein